MSRKDPRRAITLHLPRDAWRCVRARQRRSRNRRLMDTVRVMLAEALAQPDPRRCLCPPPGLDAGPGRLLQLPRDLCQRLEALARASAVTPEALICELILGKGPTASKPT